MARRLAALEGEPRHPIEGVSCSITLRQVSARYIVLPKGADIALPGGCCTLGLRQRQISRSSCWCAVSAGKTRCSSFGILRPGPSWRPIFAEPIFVHREWPTLLIDEADAFVKDNEELRGYSTAPHQAAANVIRTSRSMRAQPAGFHLGPKSIATIAP